MKIKVLAPLCVLGFCFVFFSAQPVHAAVYVPQAGLPAVTLVKAGDLIKTKTNPTVFLVDDQLTRWPVSAQAYAVRYNNNFTLVKIVADNEIGTFDPTSGINSTQAEADGSLIIYTTDRPTIYLLQNGFKRPFATWDSFTSRGYSTSKLIWVGTYDIYPTGSIIK